MAPAAGKTGTSHDAWFAAYTSNLICIVWVGNDDYTDVKLSGALAAAPIWAEFMNRAIKLPQYSDVKPFSPPEGVTVTRIDKASNLLVDDSCSTSSFSAAFLDGTAPLNSCSHMSESPQNFFQKIFGLGGHNDSNPNPNSAQPPAAPITRQAPGTPPDGNAPEPTQPAPEKKKNIFQKIFGGGGGKKKEPEPQPTPPPQ
jgi:penicillin-binding protein 1B